jgi:hypothetical protein
VSTIVAKYKGLSSHQQGLVAAVGAPLAIVALLAVWFIFAPLGGLWLLVPALITAVPGAIVAAFILVGSAYLIVDTIGMTDRNDAGDTVMIVLLSLMVCMIDVGVLFGVGAGLYGIASISHVG